MMRRTAFAAFILTLLLPTALLAQPVSVQMLQGRVYAAIDRPVPRTRDLIGDGASAIAAPLLAIGNLDTDPTDNEADWGAAVGWFLMEYANGGFREFAVVPSYQFHTDGRTAVDSDGKDRRGLLKRVAARTGAKFGLTGRISVQQTQFDLTLELLEFPGNDQKAIKQFKGELNQLPRALETLTLELLGETIGVAVSPLSTSLASVPIADIEALARTKHEGDKTSGLERLALYEKLWRTHRESPAIAAAYLVVLNHTGSTAKIREDIGPLTVRNDERGTLEVYGQLIVSLNATGGIDQAAISRLTRVLADNPNNVGAWMALSDAYVGEQVMYREDARGARAVVSGPVDHHAGYANGIATALETVGRWPNNYRSWWELSYVLKKYAGLVRGTAYWNKVPEDAQQRYRAIMAIAEESLNRALRLHPAQGPLYEMMIEYDVQARRDWLATFRRAAELEPHRRSLYQTAFNYARPQWGGTKEDMQEIYDTAIKNNPHAAWPAELRDVWAPEIKPLVDFRKRWVQIVIGLLFLCALAWCWRGWRRRSREE